MNSSFFPRRKSGKKYSAILGQGSQTRFFDEDCPFGEGGKMKRTTKIYFSYSVHQNWLYYELTRDKVCLPSPSSPDSRSFRARNVSNVAMVRAVSGWEAFVPYSRARGPCIMTPDYVHVLAIITHETRGHEARSHTRGKSVSHWRTIVYARTSRMIDKRPT